MKSWYWVDRPWLNQYRLAAIACQEYSLLGSSLGLEFSQAFDEALHNLLFLFFGFYVTRTSQNVIPLMKSIRIVYYLMFLRSVSAACTSSEHTRIHPPLSSHLPSGSKLTTRANCQQHLVSGALSSTQTVCFIIITERFRIAYRSYHCYYAVSIAWIILLQFLVNGDSILLLCVYVFYVSIAYIAIVL